MENPLILALDIGTSSVRAGLYDGNANPIRGMAVKLERSLVFSPDGGAEIDADEGLAQVAAAIDAVLEKSKKLEREIEYVATSSFWHSLVGVDARGKPTTKVLGWADTRSRAYTEILRKKFNETETHNRTGARFHSSYWPAKLLWLRKESPDIFTKTYRWLSFSDYVAHKILGETTTSVSMDSGTGILDIRKCSRDARLLKFLKIKNENLPALGADDSQTCSLTKTYAKRWPRLANAKWFPAIADGAADNIGAGCLTKSRAALMIGTSGAMRVAYSGEPPETIPAGLWCYRIDRKRVIIGGALSDGGGLYQWLKRNLRLPKDAEAKVSKRGPAEHGLSFLPFLAGERSTGYNESAHGAVTGLTSATDATDILHAALESVAFRFAEIFDRLSEVAEIEEIVASGGALRESPVWTQMIADVLGCNLAVNDARESSSRGAVLLVLESIGKINEIKLLSTAKETVIKSNKVRSEQYRVARKRHSRLYELLIG